MKEHRHLKASIFALALLVGAVQLLAVYQYDSNGSGAIVHNPGGWFDIMQDSIMTIRYYSPKSKYGQDVQFSYFTFDETGILNQGELEIKANTTVSLGEFATGDQVGFWLSSAKPPDQILYSVKEMNDDGKNYFFSGTSNKGETYWTFGDKKWGNGDVIAFINGGQPSGSSTVGQPLPGVFASLLLGGSAVCGLRRKKAKAA
ncbi:MAG: hypothetical protein GX937_13745 [Lentisphaerae bacterium]|jgi:hypothetical protein|nr:hypothetical protein [Lentisphaerota bacterium]